jgi:hypothetical protein
LWVGQLRLVLDEVRRLGGLKGQDVFRMTIAIENISGRRFAASDHGFTRGGSREDSFGETSNVERSRDRGGDKTTTGKGRS